MEIHWVNRQNNRKLVVFVLGWAADHRIVDHIRPEGCDILTLYDYSDGLNDVSRVKTVVEDYSDRWLFGWSFGVWVAEQLFSGVGFRDAVAFNGTPFPVHELYGIEPRRMAVTLRGLRAGGMDQFNRRAYGEYYDRLKPFLSPRPLERNIAELEFLTSAAVADYDPGIHWDKAVVGSDDKIFSPENMIRFWGSRAEILPLPHYPFADGDLIVKEIGGE